MYLNFAALGTLAAALAAAGLLFRRHLRAPPAAAGPVCLWCGAPAASMTGFTCPGCGGDVREAGLGPPRGGSPLRPFWVALIYTCTFLAGASALTAVMLETLPRVDVTARHNSMHVTSPEVHAVDLFLVTKGPEHELARGTLTGDAYATGGVSTLEVQLPEMRWRLLDLSGHELEAGSGLDGAVVNRWLERAGINVTTPVGRSDAAHVARALGQFAGVDVRMPPVGPAPLTLSYSSSAGGFSSVRVDERAFPLIVAGCSIVWALGLWAVLATAAGAGRARPGGAAPARDAVGGPPGCGACGYDTTGLTSLTCPECGADLRAAGIGRRQAGAARWRFAGAAAAYVLAWLFCGLALSAVVEDLVPSRHSYQYETSLAGPASGTYAAAVVKARGSVRGTRPPVIDLRVDLAPQARPGAVAPPAPPPLVVNPRTGGYHYADSTGGRVSRPSRFGEGAVLAWMAAAGVDTGDARVRDEARHVWLAAMRGARLRRLSEDSGGSSSSTSGMDGPFNTVRVAESGTSVEDNWGPAAFGVVWVVVLGAGLLYLWRVTGPRRNAAAAGTAGAAPATDAAA